MFTPNLEIRRSSIHDQYGGNRQRGISYPADKPYIFIFTGSTGKKYGYEDCWLNPSVFSYTGEGTIGDMQFTVGNLKLLKHVEDDNRVFLFESTRKAHVKFVAELVLSDFGFEQALDKEQKNLRRVIKFHFARVGHTLKYAESLEPICVPDTYENDLQNYVPNSTERSGLVTTRVGQGAYRASLIHRWENSCAVTGYENNRILIASHIVPWRDSNHNERLDVNNGILLSPVYDALFDKHLISFKDEGEIILSKDLKKTNYHKLGVTGQEKITNFRDDNYDYLDRHRITAGV